MPKYLCGCVNEMDPNWGILKSVEKCTMHRQMMGRGGMAHYTELRCLERGDACYEAEFTGVLNELNSPLLIADLGHTALEVGAGLGMYCSWLQRLGYDYRALEPDKEAAQWMRVNRKIQVYEEPFEEYLASGHPPVDLLLAAHVIEHFQDAPGMITGMFESILPGGRALLLIPDDEDKVNPDHLWFFRKEDFKRVLERVGFVDVKIATRRIVPHEKFMYATAMKP